MNKIIIDVKKFIMFQGSPESKLWDLGNKVLYKMCEDYPKHENIDKIIAKIWLIGRTYAASIERRVHAQESTDKFYIKVAKKMKDSGIDKQIQKIPSQNVLDEKSIEIISGVHCFLVKIFRELTQHNKVSLASKYLHFHKPIVPLYDSRANKSINRIIKENNRHEEIFDKLVDDIDEWDRLYVRFVIKIYNLQRFLFEETTNIYSVRDIDKYLLYLHE